MYLRLCPVGITDGRGRKTPAIISGPTPSKRTTYILIYLGRVMTNGKNGSRVRFL